jgi:hypothetical protein
MSFRWVRPPSLLQDNIERYGSRLIDAIEALAQMQAGIGQNEMRVTAPWTDRTGNARAGLLAFVVRKGNKISIYFVHSVYYGVFLELANAGKYQVVYVTMVRNATEFMRELKKLLK